MQINNTIWGLPDGWIDSAIFLNCDAKIGAINRQSYYDLWDNNYLDLNDIDISCAYWGISKNSIWCKPHFLSPYWTGSAIDVDSRPAYDDTITDLPAIFAESTSNPSAISYASRYTNVNTPPNNYGTINPILLDFNYQKIVVVPSVVYVSSISGTRSVNTTTLKDYIDHIDSDYNNYRYVIGISYQVYEGNVNGRTLRGGLHLQAKRKYIGSDIYYQPSSRKYLYFAGDNGYKQIESSISLSMSISLVLPYYTIYGDYIDQTIGDADTAFRAKYCVNWDEGTPYYNPVTVYYYDPDNPLWHVNKTWEGYPTWQQVFPFINVTNDIIDDFKNYVFKQIAYLGFIFAYDPTVAETGKLGDTGFYYPMFDDKGVTTGDYKDGIDAARLPNSEWIDARESAGYDPSVIPDNEDFGYLFNPHNTNRFATGLTVWSMYQQDILDVLAGINNLYLTDPDGNSKWQLDFKGSNPDDYIISCKAMLLDVAHSDSTYTFKLGPVSFDGIGCYKYADTGYFSFGSIDINAYYGDFRDCQPYTSMELYVPLCGTVDIDPEYFTGHSMEIIMMYDVYTGACTAGIYRDHYTLYKAVNGQIGADIPVSALQMGTYQSTVHALQAAQKQNEIRLAASAVTVAAGAAALIAAPATGGASLIAGAGLISGAAGLLGGVMQEQNYDYQIEHTQPVPAQTTAAETQNNFCVGGLYPILYIKRAKMLTGYDAEIYSHTIGNACLINGYVGSMTGLVMCSAVDLSGVPATVEEINAIKQALGKGVYV